MWHNTTNIFRENWINSSNARKIKYTLNMEGEIVEIRATSPQDKRDIKKLLSTYRVRQCILVTVDAVSILVT